MLVGHSWSGTVVSQTGADPKVTALVFVRRVRPTRRRISSRCPESSPPCRRGLAQSREELRLSVRRRFSSIFRERCCAAKGRGPLCRTGPARRLALRRADLGSCLALQTDLVYRVETRSDDIARPGTIAWRNASEATAVELDAGHLSLILAHRRSPSSSWPLPAASLLEQPLLERLDVAEGLRGRRIQDEVRKLRAHAVERANQSASDSGEGGGHDRAGCEETDLAGLVNNAAMGLGRRAACTAAARGDQENVDECNGDNCRDPCFRSVAGIGHLAQREAGQPTRWTGNDACCSARLVQVQPRVQVQCKNTTMEQVGQVQIWITEPTGTA